MLSNQILLTIFTDSKANFIVTEAIQLVEDRYKDQLNLPGEYSLLA